MVCPPVRRENQQALASGLSDIRADTHGITNLYHLHQCMPCTLRYSSSKMWYNRGYALLNFQRRYQRLGNFEYFFYCRKTFNVF